MLMVCVIHSDLRYLPDRIDEEIEVPRKEKSLSESPLNSNFWVCCHHVLMAH